MDYDSLKVFLHLSQTLHFGKTSRECFVTPSALTRIIQRLEYETNQTLFERDNRSVSLTPSGLLFRKFADDALTRWKIFRESSALGGGELSGELTIYCSVTAAYGILNSILSRFRGDYPHVHIKLKTGEEAKALQMLQDKAADLAIAAKPDQLPAHIGFIEAAVTPLLIIAPLCRCFVTEELKKSPDAWWHLPFILPEHGLARKRICQLFAKNRKKISIYADVSGNEAILAMVSLGCGIGLVPGMVLDQSPLKDKIRVLSVTPRLKPYQVGFCMNKNRHISKPLGAFWEVCRTHLIR